MAKKTGIAWTDSSFNGWVGCTKVGPGCDLCYAEATNIRFAKGANWGAGAPRKLSSDGYWNLPLHWNKAALKSGKRHLVFCASLADVFDNEVPQEWRDRLWAVMKATPALTWQIVTKRIGNAKKMLPADWGDGYPNVWLLATVVNQEELNRDLPKLLTTPATIHGLSVEPLLAPIDLAKAADINPETAHLWLDTDRVYGLDWVIVGGESGRRARPFQQKWALDIMRDCEALGIAFFFKQAGSNCVDATYTGKGDVKEEWPAYFQNQQWPSSLRSNDRAAQVSNSLGAEHAPIYQS
jgi:protein gp37